MANRNQFLMGVTDLLILSILAKEDRYVYDIIKSIEDLSNGLLNISPNTIYTATYKLESEGKISEYSKKVGKRRIRVYYHIEESGKQALEKLAESYNKVSLGVQSILKSLQEDKSEQNQ